MQAEREEIVITVHVRMQEYDRARVIEELRRWTEHVEQGKLERHRIAATGQDGSGWNSGISTRGPAPWLLPTPAAAAKTVERCKAEIEQARKALERASRHYTEAVAQHAQVSLLSEDELNAVEGMARDETVLLGE